MEGLSLNQGDLVIDREFDEDFELKIEISGNQTHLNRDQIKKLIEHLTSVCES